MNRLWLAGLILASVFSGTGAFAQQMLQPPFRLEENQGQADSEVKYVAVGSRYKANHTNDGILAPLSPKPLRIRFKGGKAQSIEPLNDLNLITNYYALEREHWHTGIRNYGRVLYRQVYPGIDVAFYGSEEQLEFDFIVAAGSDPSQ